jgi:arylsulfatase A
MLLHSDSLHRPSLVGDEGIFRLRLVEISFVNRMKGIIVKKTILSLFVLLCLASVATAQPAGPRKVGDRPNVIIIFADDLGYGDLGCYGHPTIRTPNLDKMAAQGMRFTSFYTAASVCTPSRAGLLTGRLPIRNGMTNDKKRVLFPDSAGGLPASEVTLAELLRSVGYATGCVGKWHLGHLKEFLPMAQGFDSYYGIPYSNDMDRVTDGKLGKEIFWNPKIEYWNVPLMRNEKIIERPAEQHTITKRYTEESVKFIREHKNQPFFLYLAHTMVHVPLFASKDFQGKSKRGLYGDTVEELDWSVGQILDTLRQEGLDENTIVIFSSDNGPWLIFDTHGGSAGLLRDGKGSTFEGGFRVPGIVWWPGRVKAGVVTSEMASTLDVLPTVAKLAGAKMPAGREIDGYDLGPVLFGTGPSPRETMFFYRDTKLYAVRKGAFKAHFYTRPAYGPGKEEAHNPPLLYQLDRDPSEKYDVAKDHADVIADLRKEFETHLANVKPGKNQLEAKISKSARVERWERWTGLGGLNYNRELTLVSPKSVLNWDGDPVKRSTH